MTLSLIFLCVSEFTEGLRRRWRLITAMLGENDPEAQHELLDVRSLFVLNFAVPSCIKHLL